jgi:hypothetical protein
MGDGPDWRQVDRARLLQVREEERKKLLEEWILWCETFLSVEAVKGYVATGWSLGEAIAAKAAELRARLSLPSAPLPEPKAPRDTPRDATALPETETTPLAETKTTE